MTRRRLADQAWEWVVRITGLGVFVYAAAIRDDQGSTGIAFLAIAIAVLPYRELRGWLRTKEIPGAGGSGDSSSSDSE